MDYTLLYHHLNQFNDPGLLKGLQDNKCAFIIIFSFIFISWRLVTILEWFLSYIDMNQPWI